MKIKISELYDFISYVTNKEKIFNKQIVFNKENVKVLNENNKKVSITSVIKKEDTITEITTDKGVIKTANNHLICVDGINCKNVKDLKVNDTIWQNNEKTIIKNVKRNNKKESVYDIGVDSKTHLFQTADGVVHHNSRTVENIMSLLKLQVITIEAPHVSEEDIINIPYLVRRGGVTKQENSSFEETKSGFEVVQAESALITRLKKKKPIKDAEYNMFLKQNKILRPLAEEYKETIDEVSGMYSTVLFLDEFYRSGSPRIQNLMRTILNGNLGNTPIPKNVYIIYASNMDNSDGSLDDIPLNHQFDKVNFDTPNTTDFLRYMADRFTDVDVNTGEIDPEFHEEDDNSNTDAEDKDTPSETKKGKVKKTNISENVYNAFAEAFTDNDLGGKDNDTEIRVSPRRWEEIMKYINANVPPNDLQEARELMTFLRDNFKDYKSGDISNKFKKFEKVLKGIIKETLSVKDTELIPLAPKEWRGTLDSQIKTKMKMGKDRKYVPIVSGAPGIGKTTIVSDIAKKYNLNKIIIDVSTLNADDATGLTTPTGEGKELTTEFSEPPLYTQIMNGYDKDKELEDGNAYTHILFLDEISRTGCFGENQNVDVTSEDEEFLKILNSLK